MTCFSAADFYHFMRIKLYRFLLFSLVLLCTLHLSAQSDTSSKLADSLNAAKLIEYNFKLSELENQRLRDSMQKADLEIELKSLASDENLKKIDLLNQIDALNSKEARRLAEKKAQIDSLRLTTKGAPVIGFFKDTLFLVYGRLGGFSAQDRAEAIRKRISSLPELFKSRPDSLVLVETESTVDIVLGDETIMSISETDALWANTSTYELATRCKSIIRSSVLNYMSETSLASMLKKILYALLVIGVVVVIVFYLKRLFKWLALKTQLESGKLFKGIIIRNYTLFGPQSEVNTILNLLKIVKWFLFLFIIYLALPVLFAIFPRTKDIADILLGYIFNPLKKIWFGFWNYMPNLITILVIVFVFRYLLRGIYYLKKEIETGNLKLPGFYADWANPTYQMVRVLVFAFMIVVIFPYLPGSDSPVFQGVSVFLGFLFTFGSAGSLSNIISGLVLTYMRLFKIGDRVMIGEVVGDVIEKSLLVTRVRTIKNEIISIPNSTVMNSHTINYSSDAPDKGLIIHTTVTIGYDVPWRDMHQALIDAAGQVESILKDPKPFVLQTGLEDFYVSYQINAYTREANRQAVIYSKLHESIQDICNERGIEILSPHYRSARDGNMTSIPASYLSKDYKAPSFNVNLKKEDD